MNRIQRLLTLLLLVCGMTTGAWAQESVTDLSATATANTYIVSAAGNYKFNATVKGNGGLDPLTGTTATPIAPANIAGVKVLWELGDTYGRAIKYEGGAYDISYSDGYVYFSTPSTFTTGVACVAIYDSSDNILWSWNIWSTPEPGTVTHNGKTFMDRNLCAIDLNSNRGFLYQWGRKDAFSAATGAYASFTFVPTLFTAFNTVTGIQTIDYCIKHPTTHVNNGDENSWMSEEEYNTLPWRDNIKTIYDPCPAGWRVPTAAQQNGFSGLPGTGFSNSINEFGNPGSGYYRSSTISSYPKAYAFRQSGEQNNWGTNPAFAIRPVQEPEPVPIDLQQDDEGYYLLGSVQDWRGFTEQIKYTPTANARMTADIDLGDDQTTVGTMETPFQGIFDGQGHTLTINFTPAEERFGLFRFISGATIRNLNVTGTINMAYRMVGSLVGRTDGGINNITNCRSSVHINSTTDEGHQTGGLVGRVSADVTLNISDCVFDGSIVGQSSSDYCGGIVGYNVGTLNMSNCLFMPETAEIGSSYTSTLVQDGGTTNISNCYYTSAMGTVQGTQATTEQLSDGTIAYKLQNNRTELFWGQRIGIDERPVLTSDESHRVYRSKNGGYTNNPEEAYEELKQDGEGYYLLGSVQNWQDFAALVQTTPTANARMTADIDLGDDQTMVGYDFSLPYRGIFDGQGHTLTVNYDMTTYDTAVAPFACVGDATIQNLHVDGSIIQRRCAAGGVAGTIKGNLTVKKCWVSAYMYVQGYGDYQGTIGGIASCCDDPNVRNCEIVIEDCLFSGHLGSGYHCGGLMSHVHGSDGYNNSAELNNCLNLGTCNGIAGSTGTFIRTGVQGDPYTITNCYYKIAWGAVQGTQATAEQLADGTIATALNAGREEEVWVQDPETNQPMLKIFANKNLILGDANDSGAVEIGDITSVLTLMATPDATGYNNQAADANQSGGIEIGDITTILTIMAGGE